MATITSHPITVAGNGPSAVQLVSPDDTVGYQSYCPADAGRVATRGDALRGDILQINTPTCHRLTGVMDLELIRKQTYLTVEQDRRLKEQAEQYHTTEAEILRRALPICRSRSFLCRCLLTACRRNTTRYRRHLRLRSSPLLIWGSGVACECLSAMETRTLTPCPLSRGAGEGNAPWTDAAMGASPRACWAIRL
jgi:hypothetical protein